MDRFSNFIDDNDFIDLPLSASKITWTNNQVMLAMSRIDRFLMSKEWEEHFVGVIQYALPRWSSDHRPVKLSLEEVNWGPRPFRFKNCWLLQKDFLPVVKDCCSHAIKK